MIHAVVEPNGAVPAAVQPPRKAQAHLLETNSISISHSGSKNVPVAGTKTRGLLAAHVRFALVTLALLSIARLGLIAMLGSRTGSASCVWEILSNGFRMDIIAVCYALAAPVLLAIFFGGPRGTGRIVSVGLRGYLAGMMTLFFFFEVATPAFIGEFDSRPNRLFVEYLVHPKEISAMLWNGYRVELFIGTALTLVAWLLSWRLFRSVTRPTVRTGIAMRCALLLVAAPLLFLGARSSLKHRPANPSTVAFSSDHLLNDLCLSSAYSVVYAVEQMKDEADATSVYGSFESRSALVDEVRRAMLTASPESFTSDEIPTLHAQSPLVERERPLNLVIILEESLGAQYVGALGGEPITSFIDTLQDQGWWFEQMYATGTRSVRGIEAVVAGFLPTPARSTVKLGLSQQGFFTLADLLNDKGYRTQFVYGGESHFDNMKRFFTGNGFEEIIDQDDFESPVFTGSWGVSDEDILKRAHESFLAMGDDPFFSLVFSVSNHSPWEYPEGRIDVLGDDPATVENTVRYADYALSTFFEEARNAPYWDNTVFVVVADHDSRVHGASLVPIEHFHIPAVIIGPGIEPKRESRLVSQIDLGPTLLSLIGMETEHPMIGFDLTQLPATYPGRAIMQYGGNHAFLEDGRVVIHQPGIAATQYLWDGQTLSPAPLEQAFARKALAHALMPSLLYREQLYRLPRTPYSEGEAAARLSRPGSIAVGGLPATGD